MSFNHSSALSFFKFICFNPTQIGQMLNRVIIGLIVTNQIKIEHYL